MTPVVRRAGLADLESLTALFESYRRFYGQAPEPDAARAFLHDRLDRNESVVLLALLAEQAVGFVQLYPSFSSVAMRPIWILNDLFVTQESRRKGVAHALMKAAEDFARGQGAHRLTLGTLKVNRKAKALYQKVGYVLDEDFDSYNLTL